MRLKDMVAVVTGSSRGIGRAIVLAFAREGAHVVVNYFRSEGDAMEVVSEIRGKEREAFAVKADVSNIEEVQAMINEALQRFGKIDILVNNAADFSAMDFSLDSPDWEGWDRMMAVNLKGMLICSQVVSKPMLKRKTGSIINIVANWPGGGLCYMLTKSGGIPLTRGLARVLAPHVRVNAHLPGVYRYWMDLSPFRN